MGPTPTSANPAARLAQLRIDRGAPAVSGWRRWRSPWLLAALLSALAGAVAGVWLWDGRPVEPAPAGRADASPVTGRSEGGQAVSEPAVPRPAAGPGQRSVLDATGYVVARRQATVSAEVTGKVKEILIEEGMAVSEGQVIARLDDDLAQGELALAQSRLDAARAALGELQAQLAHAGQMLRRTRALAERNLVSEAGLEDQVLARDALSARLERARREVIVTEREVSVQRRRMAKTTIRAPFAGVVVAKAAQPGEMVSPLSAGGGFTRTGLGTIVDMDSLEVEVDVNEAYIDRVRPGQAVTVALNAYADQTYAAEVLTVVPAADRTRGTVTVRVAFLTLDERVLPDMGVRVAFLDAGARHRTKENGS